MTGVTGDAHGDVSRYGQTPSPFHLPPELAIVPAIFLQPAIGVTARGEFH
jgi:hypothetical protein